jgi:hypothetical protein
MTLPNRQSFVGNFISKIQRSEAKFWGGAVCLRVMSARLDAVVEQLA